MKITTIILTFNEELHLGRCIENARKFSDRIIVVDSFSSDKTKHIASVNGVEFYEHTFYTQATQFNWVLGNVHFDDEEFIFRLDADEYLTRDAIEHLIKIKRKPLAAIHGLVVNRKIKFNGDIVVYGGLSEKWILRGFPYGLGGCDNRLMDEHLFVDGEPTKLNGCLIDECLKGKEFWFEKHKRYAKREACQYFLNADDNNLLRRLYYLCPSYIRPLIYYLFRMIIMRGFLDKKQARIFHWRQAYWYRLRVEDEIRILSNLPADERLKVISSYLI